MLGLVVAGACLLQPRAGAAQSTDAWKMTVTTTSDSGGSTPSQTLTMRVMAANDIVRTEIDAAAGSPTAGFYVLMNGATGRMTNVMPAQRIAMTSSGLAGLFGPGGMIQVEIVGEPLFTVEDLGVGEPVLGHPTRHYRATQRAVFLLTVAGVSCRRTMSSVTDEWSATDLAVPAAIRQSMLRPFGPAESTSPFGAAAAKLQAIHDERVKGIVLRAESSVDRPNSASGPRTVKSRIEVTELAKVQMDSSSFAIPAGYTVMDQGETMSSLDPELLAGAMKDGMRKQCDPVAKD
jgi:hypothetical protein